MTLILRRIDRPLWWNLRRAGRCRVSLCEIVGMFPSASNRTVFLES
jgi:hypothetical protein